MPSIRRLKRIADRECKRAQRAKQSCDAVQITNQQIKQLYDQKITTTDQLWARIGEEFNAGIENLAKKAQVDQAWLIQLLTYQIRRDAQTNGDSWLKQRWLGIAVLLILAILVGLGIRWYFTSDPAVIAARDLAKDQIIRLTDLQSVELAIGANYFTRTADLTGLILTRNVARGKPLRYDDVQRLQVAAATDIPAGAIIASNMITVTWSTYQPGAATKIDQVLQRRASRALRKGTPIIMEAISDLKQIDYVVVRSDDGLPAFHVIEPADITVAKKPEGSGAFTSTAGFVGRYTLQAIPAGAALRGEQISTARLARSDLAGRRIITVQVTLGAMRSALAPPARVSLLFTEQGSTTPNTTIVQLDRVIVLDIKPTEKGDWIVAAITPDDLNKIQPILGRATINIIQ